MKNKTARSVQRNIDLPARSQLLRTQLYSCTFVPTLKNKFNVGT